MEIFNISILEFLMIGGLALVVFGPERLPEVGRFLGQQMARFLAWQQQSPELQMLNEVRGEFEREIASLRDELVRTRSQLDISRDVSAIKDELRPMLDLKGSLTTPPAQAGNGIKPPVAPGAETPAIPAPASESGQSVEALFDVAEAAVDEPSLIARPATQTVPAAVRPDRLALTEPTTVLSPQPAAHAAAEPMSPPPDEQTATLADRRNALDPAFMGEQPEVAPVLGTPEPHTADMGELLGRLGELSATLQALVGELQERGVLGSGWQAPARPAEQETISR